ncbi:U1 small nuclear ribonucleoprotein, putative [Plasmodium vinckei]|uniref:U1 small nuclear ribonucleoprotein, putative n=1 Tax=Plasmodium vinckei TaxID=5860 RepID=A0A6V7T8L7_PLAVN|nr:U1 small nuclear ribonucleoprotein, putative [Plasmodium vinckei]
MSAIGLPPHILILFQSRPLLDFHKPIKKKKPKEYSGISDFLNYFEDGKPPPKIKLESPKERKERKKKEKIAYNELILKEKKKEYDPFKNNDISSDPKKTLFIGRLSYEVNEKKLKKEFETYGKIKYVKVICDQDKKPRGYAFIEFEHTKSVTDAYNLADGKKIENRRILVDMERARTVKNWLPRRLGGGKGPSRGSDERKKMTHNVNWNALINKDKYRDDKRKHDDPYKNIPLYNERNDDGLYGNSSSRDHRSHRGSERSSKRDRNHRSRRSDSRDRHHHKHRKREHSRNRSRDRDRDRDRHRDRDRDRHRDRDRDRNRDRDRHRHRDKNRDRHNDAHYDKEEMFRNNMNSQENGNYDNGDLDEMNNSNEHNEGYE